MKIRLMTFHTPKNYGAVLQAYALMSTLQQKCTDVRIIDFNTVSLKKRYSLIPRFNNIKGFILSVLCLYLYPHKKEKYCKFENFVKTNLLLTKRYESSDLLYSEKWDKDIVFVCGSDQVFNPNRIIDEQSAFYLDFVPENNLKFSYAASFGIKTIPLQKKEIISTYLKKFDMISVREKSGCKIVQELISEQAVEVVDPTLLKDKEFWEKIEKPYKKMPSRYLLYYRLLNTRDSDRIAMKKAKEMGLKLVVVSDSISKGLKCDRHLHNVGPEELLWLYNNSEYVVTDSFHGVAFSVIYKKKFTFSDMNTVTNERGLNLINQLGIEKESVYGIDSSGRIDYDYVGLRIKELQLTANQFIDKAIGMFNGEK